MKKISIVLIAKDEIGVQPTINAILNHDTKYSFEIILVIKKWKKSSNQNDKVKVLMYENDRKRITIPEQRNVGVKSAAGEVIVFIDTSCIPQDGWLDSLYENYLKSEKIVAGYVGLGDVKKGNAFGDYHKTEYLEECPTANVLIAKEVFEKIGYFDEKFEYGSDVDFMWRARNAGYKIKYEPNSIVTHDEGTLSSEFDRSFRYGKARLQLYLKHSDRVDYFIKKDMMIFFYVIFILFSPIALVFPVYFLILLIPIIKNVHTSPFKQVALNLTFALGIISKAVSLVIHHE